MEDTYWKPSHMPRYIASWISSSTLLTLRNANLSWAQWRTFLTRNLIYILFKWQQLYAYISHRNLKQLDCKQIMMDWLMKNLTFTCHRCWTQAFKDLEITKHIQWVVSLLPWIVASPRSLWTFICQPVCWPLLHSLDFWFQSTWFPVGWHCWWPYSSCLLTLAAQNETRDLWWVRDHCYSVSLLIVDLGLFVSDLGFIPSCTAASA